MIMSTVNVFLLLVTNLYAISVRSTRTNWVNEYHSWMDWVTSSNRMVTGFYSVHNNRREDRKWKFDQGSASGVQCKSRRWVNKINSYDGVLSFSCDPKEAVSGFRSTYIKHYKDRRWDIQCCKVSNAMVIARDFTGYLNNNDGVLDFTCANDEVLVGVYSIHDNHREDRIWKARCAQLTKIGDFIITSTWTGEKNWWDKKLVMDGGVNGMITGLSSIHNNHSEDRRWKFFSGSAPGLGCSEQRWSGWINAWDKSLYYVCPSNQVLHGIQSYHDNHREDRRWKFQCCRVSSGVSVVRSKWTWYLNEWDGELEYQCPRHDQAIVGMYSYHSNTREDRRWRVQCGVIRK